MVKKAVISLSGGLDSTMLLMTLLSEGYEVRAYAFDYGQKHTIELEKVQKNIKFLQEEKHLPVTLQVINLRDCFSDSASSLCSFNNAEIPHARYDHESQKETVVEQRNVIFSAIIYGKALGWSKKTNSDVLISLGLHANDTSVYPDTTPESQEAARHLFKISNWGSERVDYIAPFININKAQVLERGVEAMGDMNFSEEDVNYILQNTHSCYSPDREGRSCGKCGTCQERIASFAINNMFDPLAYSVDDEELKKLYLKYKEQGL